MIKNYLKIAWRNLIKNKAHTFINVTGLSVGMAVAILIGLWIWDELSYDTYFQNHDKIVQVWQHQTFNGKVGSQVAMPIPLGTMLSKNYRSDFKYVVLSSWNFDHILSYGDKKITQSGSFMEPEAPDMLTLHMLKGSRGALKDPSSIILSDKVAKIIFGDADPMNKTLKLDNKQLVKVAGVYQDLPHNTTFRDLSFIIPWDLYLSSQAWVKEATTRWGNNSFQIFAQLRDNANINIVDSLDKND